MIREAQKAHRHICVRICLVCTEEPCSLCKMFAERGTTVLLPLVRLMSQVGRVRNITSGTYPVGMEPSPPSPYPRANHYYSPIFLKCCQNNLEIWQLFSGQQWAAVTVLLWPRRGSDRWSGQRKGHNTGAWNRLIFSQLKYGGMFLPFSLFRCLFQNLLDRPNWYLFNVLRFTAIRKNKKISIKPLNPEALWLSPITSSGFSPPPPLIVQHFSAKLTTGEKSRTKLKN